MKVPSCRKKILINNLMNKLLIPLALLMLWSCTGQEPEQPNIIFIMTDDHAYQAVGAYGSEINTTPNL